VNTIERFYQAFEEKVSRSMRVLLVVAVTVVLLSALFMVIIGAVKSGKDATLETEVDGLEYDKAKEILFNKQIQVEEEEVAADEKKAISPRILAIHKSIRKHFEDEKANREQFDDTNRGVTAEDLEGTVNFYASGMYEIGSLSGVPFPSNDIGCREGQRFPMLNLDEYDQMLDGMVEFWKNAEVGTSSNASKFNSIKRYNARLGTVMIANDLFLCGFANSKSELEVANNQRKSEAALENAAGIAMIAGAGGLLDVMFKFFAAFAVVFLSLILIRIEKALKE